MQNLAWVLLLSVLALACGGDDEAGFEYGPCARGGCSGGAALQSSDGTCLCALPCHVDEDDCPQPSTGDVEAICMDLIDVVHNGYDGRCDLPCSDGDTCPDASQCISGFCRYSSEP